VAGARRRRLASQGVRVLYRFGLLLLLQTVGVVGPAHAGNGAETVFDNGLPDGAAGFFADVDHDQVVADDFQLGSDQTAAAIQWFGSYLSDDPPVPERFVVTYHDDAAGEPAGPPFAVVDELIVRQATGTTTESGRPIFLYETAGPGMLAANTRYWVTIQKQDTGDPAYLWLASNPLGGSALFQVGGGSWQVLGVEQAFRLLPEPHAGFSVVAALLTLAVVRRRST